MFQLFFFPEKKPKHPNSWSLGQLKRKELIFPPCPFSGIYNWSTLLIYTNFYIDINVYFYVHSEISSFGEIEENAVHRTENCWEISFSLSCRNVFILSPHYLRSPLSSLRNVSQYFTKMFKSSFLIGHF